MSSQQLDAEDYGQAMEASEGRIEASAAELAAAASSAADIAQAMDATEAGGAEVIASADNLMAQMMCVSGRFVTRIVNAFS